MELTDINWSLWIGIILWVLGLIGTIFPLIPGVLCSMAAFGFWYWGADITMGVWLFYAILVFGLLILVLEFFIPAKLVKMSGGSKSGGWGALIGGILGATVFGFILTPIIGIPIFTILGAYIAEIMAGNSSSLAWKSAFASGIGFMIGVGMKFVYALLVLIGFLF